SDLIGLEHITCSVVSFQNDSDGIVEENVVDGRYVHPLPQDGCADTHRRSMFLTFRKYLEHFPAINNQFKPEVLHARVPDVLSAPHHHIYSPQTSFDILVQPCRQKNCTSQGR